MPLIKRKFIPCFTTLALVTLWIRDISKKRKGIVGDILKAKKLFNFTIQKRKKYYALMKIYHRRRKPSSLLLQYGILSSSLVSSSLRCSCLNPYSLREFKNKSLRARNLPLLPRPLIRSLVSGFQISTRWISYCSRSSWCLWDFYLIQSIELHIFFIKHHAGLNDYLWCLVIKQRDVDIRIKENSITADHR